MPKSRVGGIGRPRNVTARVQVEGGGRLRGACKCGRRKTFEGYGKLGAMRMREISIGRLIIYCAAEALL